MSMDHRRAVGSNNRVALRQRLEAVLGGAPDGLAMHIARAATLSGPEAQRILGMAARQNDDIGDAQVEEANRIIEKASVTP